MSFVITIGVDGKVKKRRIMDGDDVFEIAKEFMDDGHIQFYPETYIKHDLRQFLFMVDEDAVPKDLSLNLASEFFCEGKVFIHGPVVVAKINKNGDFYGLTEEDVEKHFNFARKKRVNSSFTKKSKREKEKEKMEDVKAAPEEKKEKTIKIKRKRTKKESENSEERKSKKKGRTTTETLTDGTLNDFINYLVKRGNKKKTGNMYHNMGFVLGTKVLKMSRIIQSKLPSKLRTPDNKIKFIEKEVPEALKISKYILDKQNRQHQKILKSGYDPTNTDLNLVVPMLVNLYELENLLDGKKDKMMKAGPKELNHFILIVYCVGNKYLYLLDSLASDLIKRYVKEYFADTIFRTKMFEQMYKEYIDDDAVLNEITMVTLTNPQQVKSLCPAYMAYYAYMLMEKDKSMEEIYTDPNCNDNYIESVWLKELGEIVKKL